MARSLVVLVLGRCTKRVNLLGHTGNKRLSFPLEDLARACKAKPRNGRAEDQRVVVAQVND